MLGQAEPSARAPDGTKITSHVQISDWVWRSPLSWAFLRALECPSILGPESPSSMTYKVKWYLLSVGSDLGFAFVNSGVCTHAV